MFIVLEIQTEADGTVKLLPPLVKTARDGAESAFHSILSFAAVSSVAMHAAVLMTNEGTVLEKKAYTHEQEAAE